MAAVATSHLDATSNGKTWHAQYPELGTGPVPIEPYISQEYFALERERIFRKVSVYGNMEHRPTPVEGMAFQFGSLIIRNDFSMDNLPPGVNPTRDPSWALDLNVIFPNFFVDVSEGTYFTYNFPLDTMPPEAQRLLYLTLSLAEVAPAVELFK